MHKVQIELGKEKLELTFGALPSALQMLLSMAGCDAIIGNDLFNHFNPISYNLPSREVCFVKRTDKPKA